MIQRLATIVNYYLRYQIIGLETQQRVISFYWLRSFEFDFNFNYLHISESNNKALSALFRIASPLYLLHIGVWWMHGWKDTYINNILVDKQMGRWIERGIHERMMNWWECTMCSLHWQICLAIVLISLLEELEILI